MSTTGRSRSKPKRPEGGFALILSLALMGFLVVLTLSLASIAGVRVHQAAVRKQQLSADLSARMGLQIAIGNLQKFAGPDQRVTAGPGFEAISGDSANQETSRLTGVFDTQNGGLMTYLASGLVWPTDHDDTLNSPDDALNYTPGINARGIATDDDTAVLVGEATLGGTGSSGKFVAARKKDITTNTGNATAESTVDSRYAYWVADEGVKARVNLPAFDDDTTSGAGDPDHQFSLTAFRGAGTQFISGLEEFPFHDDKLASLFDSNMLDVYESGAYAKPAASAMHDITFYSAGVLADVRRGGLKKDLSLAFEMSDNAFNANMHFAGDNSVNWPYVDFNPRYVYRFADPGGDFGPGISPSGNKSIKGPTWHALRNHYRLYKDLRKSGDGFELDARIDGPLQTPGANHYYNRSIPHQWNMDAKIRPDDPTVRDYTITVSDKGEIVGPVLRPTSPAINPVITSIRYKYSARLKRITDTAGNYYPNGTYTDYRDKMQKVMNISIPDTDEYFVQIIWDPIVTIWNPYNVALSFEGIKLRTREIPTTFEVTLREARLLREGRGGPDRSWVISNSNPGYIGGSSASWDIKFGDFIGNRGVGNIQGFVENGLWFVIGTPGSKITLKPGELKVYSFANSNPVPIDDFLNSMSSHQATSIILRANEGWDDSGGLLVDTSISGNMQGPRNAIPRVNAQRIKIRARSRLAWKGDMDYFMQAFILHNYNSDDDALEDPNTDIDHWEMLEYSAIGLEDTQFAEHGEWSDWLVFGNQIRDQEDFKWPLGEMFYQMKTAEQLARPVALAQYNNPRARVNARLPNQPYKVVDPLWHFEHRDPSELNVFVSPNNNGYWGAAHESGDTHVTLFEVPTVPMTSIGSLKHANVNMRGHQPMYALGDSFMPPFINNPKHVYDKYRNDRPGATAVDVYVPDRSLLMNDAIWDSYFFSSIAPQKSSAFQSENPRDLGQVIDNFIASGEPLPNARMVYTQHEGADFKEAIIRGANTEDDLTVDAPSVSAAYLLNEGAFNVNSTSVDAWKALLGSMRDAVVTYMASESENYRKDSSDGTPFSRFGLPNGSSDETWRGFARLSDHQVEDLAVAIVDEVRERGPFMSMSDFVNRKVKLNPVEPSENRERGTLQAAIEEVNSINSQYGTPAATTSNNGGSLFPKPQYAEGDTYAGAAAYLLQSDMLVGLGPALTVRSDTFRVRAYGEAVNPLTGERDAERWIEAIVQRTPIPVKRGSERKSNPDYYEYFKSGIDGDNDGFPDNREIVSDYGRRFKIVSIRWLNKEEI